jgi:hypothetical protein
MNRLLFLALAMTFSGIAFAHPGTHAHVHPFAGAEVFAVVLAAVWAAMLGGRLLRAALAKKNGR